MEKKKRIKYIADEVISATILIIFMVWMVFAFLTEDPNGHYEGTKTRQANGNYYVWVED